MATLIKPDGTSEEVKPENGTDFKLKELQGFVGGMIQIIRLRNRKIMVVNDEGKLENLPPNSEATALALKDAAIFHDDWISGDALICDTNAVK